MDWQFPHPAKDERGRRGGEVTLCPCWFWGASRYSSWTPPISLPYQRFTRTCQLSDQTICWWLSTVQANQLPTRSPNTPRWPQQPTDLGRWLGYEVQCQKMLPAKYQIKIKPLLHHQRPNRGFNATLSYLAFMKFFRRVKKHVSVSAFILFFTIL